MKKNILKSVALTALLVAGSIAHAQINYNSQNCQNAGKFSSAIGDGCISNGEYSFAGGWSSRTGSSARSSFSYGQSCITNGNHSLALGYFVTAQDGGATAIGTYLTVSGGSVAIGRGYDNTDRMVVDRTRVIALGFDSNLPTMTVFSAPGKNRTGKVAIGNVTGIEPSAKLHIKADKHNGFGEDADILLQSQAGFEAAVCFQNKNNRISVATDSNAMNFTAGGFSFESQTSMNFISNDFIFVPRREMLVNGSLRVNRSVILTELAGDTARRMVCVNSEGCLETMNVSSVRDNMGNHVAERNIHLNGFKLVNSKDNGGIFLDGNNRVGIGTSTPLYELSVNGTILAKELIVSKLDEDWPDYVFDPEYKLTSLEELGSYVKDERHLPGVPSAKEMEDGGIKVGEMNAILLKKIEELTLYVIELQQQINELKGEQK